MRVSGEKHWSLSVTGKDSGISECVRGLIRRTADIQGFRALVEDGLGSGPAVEADDALFEELRAEIRTRAAE